MQETAYKKINYQLCQFSATLQEKIKFPEESPFSSELIELIWDYDEDNDLLDIQLVITPQSEKDSPEGSYYYNVMNVDEVNSKEFGNIAFELTNGITKHLIRRYGRS